jgi:transcriptional regulator with XRE-family HTH domain
LSFGEEIKAIRESKGLTVNQLALYSGISAATISRIETGKRGIPKAPNLQKLAEALKISYEDLLSLAGYIKLPDKPENKNIDKQLFEALKELPEDKKIFLLEVIKHITHK